MISEQHGFVFVHVPKTAGNSVQHVLKPHSEDELTANLPHQDGVERFSVSNRKFGTHKHSFLSHYRAAMPADLYRSFFKFATIRNPWERMVSLYFSPAQGRTELTREAFETLIREAVPTRDFICLPAEDDDDRAGAGAAASAERLAGDVDMLMRFEALDDDFQAVCGRLAIPHSPLRIRNRSRHRHYSTYYDEELDALVRLRFADEIELGDYRIETA